ncbi:unnamed protein product [Auanema sp. JU1783]|nr:unnamed protein product [Auanema sp. JU1783]
MGQAASIPYNHCHVNYPRQPIGSPVRAIHAQEHLQHIPAVPSAPAMVSQPNAIVVPLHYYPNSFYTPSAGNGGSIINRIEDRFTELNERVTESLDGNRFYNQVRDPNIPIPPGHIVQTNTYVPVSMNTPQGVYPPPQTTSHAYYGSPPPYTPTAPQFEESLYPSFDDMEKKMKNLEVGSKS